MPLNQPTRVLLGLVQPSAPQTDSVLISELAVLFRVGVPEEERAQPQRLLLNLELTFDVSKAAMADSISETVDYYAVAQRLIRFGEGRSWKLIETLACDAAEMILREFRVQAVSVEVRKFIIPETGHVAVRILRVRGLGF
jgi:FolB domain-containing protein